MGLALLQEGYIIEVEVEELLFYYENCRGISIGVLESWSVALIWLMAK